MVIIKANKDSEAGVLPDAKFLTEMGKYNEELVKAGVMLAGEGLYPSSKGVRVRFSEGKSIVIDGPSTETKECTCSPSRIVLPHTAQVAWGLTRPKLAAGVRSPQNAGSQSAA